MNSLDDLIHKHFILNNADIFRPYFFKYCNLIYGREYPYNTDNVRKMLEGMFSEIIWDKFYQGYTISQLKSIIIIAVLLKDRIFDIDRLCNNIEKLLE